MGIFLQILFGVLAGIIAGMGMGGGTLLIPMLIIFLNFTQLQAQTINLIAFLPMALIALVIHFKNHLVKYKDCILIAIIGVASSILGSFLASLIEMDNLKIYFGTFLIILGTFQFAKIVHNKNF